MAHERHIYTTGDTISFGKSFRHKTGMSEPEQPRFNLRLTPSLQRRIKHAAIDNDRSINAEIIARLELSFAPDAATHLGEALTPFANLDPSERDQVKRLLNEAFEVLSRGKAARTSGGSRS